jgi:hypothetical protein
VPVNFIQPSFAAGELTPNMYARVDLAKYHIGLKLLRNFFVLPQGGAANRAGTMFVGRSKSSTYAPHLIPFQFNLIQTYVLEFGHLYMRVIMDGGYVLEPTIAISAITNANPGVVTTGSAHGYSNGDQVFIVGTGTLLDSTPGKQYLVANVTTTTFTLTDLDGNAINTTGYGSYSGVGGTVARAYTLTTPYNGYDVQLIKWTQSADVLTLCHPNYPPYDLTRTQHWSWALTEISFAPTATAPGSCSVTGTAGSWYYEYVVTAVMNSPPSESLPSSIGSFKGDTLNQDTGVQNAISWPAVPGAAYYNVYKANPDVNAIPAGAQFGYIGYTAGTVFYDLNIAPDFTQSPPQGQNPFAAGSIATVSVANQGSGYSNTSPPVLVVIDATGSGAVLRPSVSGGKYTSVAVTQGGSNYTNPTIKPANGGSGASITCVCSGTDGVIQSVTVANGGTNYYGNVTLTPPGNGSGAQLVPVISNGVIQSVNIINGGSGYSGTSVSISQDSGSGATFSCTINSTGNYPSCATYFQQRKVFAASLNGPQTIWMTQPGDYHNMDTSNPSKASDAITVTIAANTVNAIKWLTPMNNLVVFSSGGAWALLGGSLNSPQAVTPSNTVVVPQSYVGCADLPPIVVNYDILYVQAKGSTVRDLAYNFYAQVYTGTDMSILSNHLFFGHNLERWAYAEQPFYQVWAVRDDGVLLSFTYLKEQDVYAWAHHDSPGNSGTDQFISVASIPEQQITGINMDSIYLVVQRTIPGINSGNPVYYVERMDGRNFLTNGVSDVAKAWFVDCGLRYSGSAVTTISGLDHLNGATVSILADGTVQPQQVVLNGSITLQYPGSTVTVGLPYVSQMQTLCMEPEGMAMQVQDYRKKISAVAVRVADTRGLKVGPSFTDLTEIKERSALVSMGSAIPLFTGDERLVIDNKYLVDDDVCIEQDNPLPCTVLGVVPEVSIGDSPG